MANLMQKGDKRFEVRVRFSVADWDDEEEKWVETYADAKTGGATMLLSAEMLAQADFDPRASAREELHRKTTTMLEELFGVAGRDTIHRRFRELVAAWPREYPFPYEIMEKTWRT